MNNVLSDAEINHINDLKDARRDAEKAVREAQEALQANKITKAVLFLILKCKKVVKNGSRISPKSSSLNTPLKAAYNLIDIEDALFRALQDAAVKVDPGIKARSDELYENNSKLPYVLGIFSWGVATLLATRDCIKFLDKALTDALNRNTV